LVFFCWLKTGKHPLNLWGTNISHQFENEDFIISDFYIDPDYSVIRDSCVLNALKKIAMDIEGQSKGSVYIVLSKDWLSEKPVFQGRLKECINLSYRHIFSAIRSNSTVIIHEQRENPIA